MKFNRDGCKYLSEEISTQRERLSLNVLLTSENDNDYKVLGIANVELWVMIENLCVILRQVIKQFVLIYFQKLKK